MDTEEEERPVGDGESSINWMKEPLLEAMRLPYKHRRERCREELFGAVIVGVIIALILLLR